MVGRTDLDRNATADGSCKYAIIRLDKLRIDADDDSNPNCIEAQSILDFLLGNTNLLPNEARVLRRDYLEVGRRGDPEECFVIKLKDENAAFALEQYANSAKSMGMQEYGDKVQELADRSRAMRTKRPD